MGCIHRTCQSSWPWGARRIDTVEVYDGEPDQLNTAPWVAALSFGKRVEEVEAAIMEGLNTRFLCDYGGTTMEIANRLGLDYDEYCQNHETILSDCDFDTQNPLFGLVKKGTTGTHCLNMGIKKDGKEIVGFHIVHKASQENLPDLDLDFKIEITGENHIVAGIEGFQPKYCDVFLPSEAPNVNLIPGLAAAEPGYKSALDIAVINLPR